jgi:hypothetical protein
MSATQSRVDRSCREAELLRLVQAQSVPFAMPTTDPVLDDLVAYPNIHRHVMTHYREREGRDRSRPGPATSGRQGAAPRERRTRR